MRRIRFQPARQNFKHLKNCKAHWARQTVIYAILVRDHFEGNPFDAPAHVRRVSAKAKEVVSDLWREALCECTIEQLPMVFVGKVIDWVKRQDDATAQVP
jgi:hypothetical protein